MTTKFRSKPLPPSRITQGQSPPNGTGLAPFFGVPFKAGLKGVPQKAREIPHESTSRHRSPKKSRPMNATEIAATLSVRAEDVCRRYLPRGRKQGRYWTVGDTNGAKGRSLFVRMALRAYPRNGPAPRPTSMDICSISSVCAPAEHRCAAPWRRPSRSSHCRRPLPPMAPPPRVCSAPGSTTSDPPRPTSPARAKHLGASTAAPCDSAGPPLARPCLPARASKPCYLWSPPSPAFMRRRLYRQAISVPSNHPKTSPCRSLPAIKT